MNLREVYKLVLDKLDTINFELLWTGFRPYKFALYNDHQVFLEDREIPLNDNFIGNTSINYNGNYIAIWHISNDQEHIDIDLLVSNIVHEMFHCYQNDCNDSRYPNDLLLLDYPNNLSNYISKFQENIELVKALESKDAFERFASIRKKRINLIGEVIEQEFKTETMEGLAEYVGTMALKQLSLQKYNQRVEKYSKIITSISDIQFCIRRISYYTGVLFFISLFKHGYKLSESLANNKTFFSQLIDLYSFNIDDEEQGLNKELEMAFNEYVNKKEMEFQDFLSTHDTEIKYESYICGYDPMNMIKKDDMILCSHFILLKSDEENNPRFINQPVLLKLKSNSINLVDSYIL